MYESTTRFILHKDINWHGILYIRNMCNTEYWGQHHNRKLLYRVKLKPVLTNKDNDLNNKIIKTFKF